MADSDMSPRDARIVGVVTAGMAALLTWAAATRDARLSVPPSIAYVAALALVAVSLRCLQVVVRPGARGYGFGVVILGCYAVIGGWIAIGPGARSCTLQVNEGDPAPMSGLGCRVPFGIGALIVAALALYVAALWWRARKGREDSAA